MGLVNFAGVALDMVRIEEPDRLAPIIFLREGLGLISQWNYRAPNWPEAVCRATGQAEVVCSRQGHGQSAPAAQCSYALNADYLPCGAWEVLPSLPPTLRIGPLVLLDHSNGATIALLHASRHAVAAWIAMAPDVIVEAITIIAITQTREAFGQAPCRHGQCVSTTKRRAAVRALQPL